MNILSPDLKLLFLDLSVSVGKQNILQNVSGEAKSGNLLSVMGPTGSGKTTLLNALAGRISVSSGNICLNGVPFEKQQRRRMGYVTQEDLFLSNLTLWETLYFTAMIRISDKITKEEKKERINAIVDCLGLQQCMHTVIGDILNRGLSGGEKKRANIACELLADPDILLIDEPTSGLDSSSAHSLMIQLRNYATEFNKTVVMTIHQPSSQIYKMFSSLLLLAHGQTAYFGKADQAIDFVTGLGMINSPNYNPADFLLELLTSEENAQKMIQENKIFRTHNESPGNDTKIKGNNVGKYPLGSETENNALHCKTAPENVELYGIGKDGYNSTTTIVTVEGTPDRWPTSFWTQLRMLIWRSFKQAKGRIFHKFDLVQSLCIGVIVGILYFQIELSPNTIRDRMGLVLFTVLHWGFEVMIFTITGCCTDRGVYKKDRTAGAYRLSAYYLAKITSEIPLLLTMPFLFHTLVYWMSGLGDVDGYFVMFGLALIYCLFAQGVADVIGAAITSFRLCIATIKVVNIGSLLLGGFFNIHPSEWFTWIKYVSIVHYPYAATMSYLLSNIGPIWCNQTSSNDFPQCLGNSTEALTTHDILSGIGIDLQMYCYIVIMLVAFCVIRILGYFVLKYKRI